jgi:N-acetyl-alpha-D-glucosaminyl L-malate synthase BshA
MGGPVRIGVVCYPTYGGSGVVATELAYGLAARGHRVHVISYAQPARMEPFDESVRFHEVEVSSYPLFRYPPYDLALASRLADVAEEAHLDLVHVHYAIPHAHAALLVKQILDPRPFPVVTTLHGTDITIVGQDRAYARVTRHALQASDAVTCVSAYLERETRRIFQVDREIDVVPNFIDPDRFSPSVQPQMKTCFAPHGEPVLLHLSNFRPVKRSILAVEAFATVRAARPATLLMVGDGPDRSRCEARARELGLRGSVRFLGAQGNVEGLVPVADVLLLPSEYESFGLAALEAMACGVVPFATRAGGLVEVIQDGVDGFLVPDEDMDRLGERVRDLLADPERLARLKIQARESAVSRFSRDRIVPLYEAVYERVLAPARS